MTGGTGRSQAGVLRFAKVSDRVAGAWRVLVLGVFLIACPAFATEAEPGDAVVEAEAGLAAALAAKGDGTARAAARNTLALALRARDPADPRVPSLWRAALAELAASGAAAGPLYYDISAELARTEMAAGDRTAADRRLAAMVDRARDTSFHGPAVFAAADIYYQAGNFPRAVEAFLEGLTVQPERVRPVYGALFVAFAEAQETAEASGAVADASALIDARVAILQTFLDDGAPDAVQTLLFQKYFLLQREGDWGAAADALRRWAAAGPLDADERAFIEETARLQLTATELSGYSAARDVQLGQAELAVAFTELLQDPLDPLRARALRARAAAETGLGLLAEAGATLLEAAALLERSDDPRDLHLLYGEMATNAWQRGDLGLAQALDRRAGAAYLARLSAGDPPLAPIDLAIRNTNSALIATDAGRPREALDRLAQARADYEEAAAGGALKWNEKSLAARIEEAAAAASAALGAGEEAIAATRRAVTLAREALPAGHPDLALILSNAADLLFTQAQGQEALPLLREAVAINDEALPPTLPQAIEVERKLALYHLTRGDLDAAGTALARITRARKAPAYRDALGEAAIDFEMYAYAELGRGAADKAIEALQWTEVSRSAEAIAQMEARFSLADPAQALLVRRRQDLVEAHRRAASDLLASFGDEVPRRQREAKEAELAQLDGELTRVETALGAAGFDVASIGSVEPLATAEIEALLGEDEALVLFLLPGLDPARLEGVSESTNRVIAITREGVIVAVVPEESRRRLRRRIADFRCAMAASDPGCGGAAAGTRGAMLEDDGSPDIPFDTAAAHALWRDLFGGIEPALAQKSHLILVPPADLLDLPFAALVTSPEPPDSLGEVAWMIRRHAISVLPSVAGLKTLRRQAGGGALAPFLGVGDPAIGQGGAIACDALGSIAMRSAAPTASVVDASPTGLADVGAIAALPRLPDAACEVAAIAGAIGPPSRLLLGAAATETAIKAMDASGELAGYRTIVFATHGLIAGEAGAAAPGLVLTPPAEASLADDGLLTSAEIATLRLDAELVVLSACNTAAGERGDAEGLSGLARAFFHAGARSLLVTHWAVYSEAAVMISTGALARLREDPSLGHAEALRQATLAILDAPGQSRMRLDPAFWAAFTIVGAT